MWHKKGGGCLLRNPVQLEQLNVTQPIILDDAILAQVAQRVTQTLTPDCSNKPKANARYLTDVISLLADNPLTSTIQADLNSSTLVNPVYF